MSDIQEDIPYVSVLDDMEAIANDVSVMRASSSSGEGYPVLRIKKVGANSKDTSWLDQPITFLIVLQPKAERPVQDSFYSTSQLSISLRNGLIRAGEPKPDRDSPETFLFADRHKGEEVERTFINLPSLEHLDMKDNSEFRSTYKKLHADVKKLGKILKDKSNIQGKTSNAAYLTDKVIQTFYAYIVDVSNPASDITPDQLVRVEVNSARFIDRITEYLNDQASRKGAQTNRDLYVDPSNPNVVTHNKALIMKVKFNAGYIIDISAESDYNIKVRPEVVRDVPDFSRIVDSSLTLDTLKEWEALVDNMKEELKMEAEGMMSGTVQSTITRTPSTTASAVEEDL